MLCAPRRSISSPSARAGARTLTLTRTRARARTLTLAPTLPPPLAPILTLARCASGLGDEQLQAQCVLLGTPFLQALLPSFGHEPAALRHPQLLELLEALLPALPAPDALQAVALLLPAALGAAQELPASPYIPIHPRTSPYISVHLRTSPCISPGAAQELTTAATAPGADGSAAAAAASLGAAAMSLLKGCARQHGASLAPQAPALAASLPSALEWGLTVTLSSGAQRRHDALTRTLTPKYPIAQTITATLTLTATQP